MLQKPEAEKEECREILEKYGVGREASALVVRDLCVDHEKWVQFMMDFELKLDKPNVSRAWISAATMGAAYFIGMSVPFFFCWDVLLGDTRVRLVADVDLFRGLDPDDTIFCDAERHPCSLRLDRHHSRHPSRFRLPQELGHGPDEAECGVWSDSNALYWCVGSWRELWHCKGDR